MDRGVVAEKRQLTIVKESLTSSNNSGTSSTRLGTATTKSQKVSEPAQLDFLAVAVKVGNQSSSLLEELLLAVVGRVADGEESFDPARASGDCATVHKDIETGLTPVSTLTALANTTEGEGGDVQGGVVDGNTAGAGL